MSDGSKCPVLMTHHDSSFFKTVMESGETLDSESLFQIATEASNEHLQYDENSGMYFDKEKDMYYDPTSSIYYDYKNGTYYRAEFAYLSFRYHFFYPPTVICRLETYIGNKLDWKHLFRLETKKVHWKQTF